MLPDLLPLYDPGPGRSVRGGMVLSADGGAAHEGRSRALSTPADRAVFRVLRAHADVVLVGAGTARAEDYGEVRLSDAHRAWREAAGRPPVPPVAVVSRGVDVPRIPGALVVTTGQEQDAGRDVLHVRDLADALDQLAARGLTRVLCEGGPSLLGDLVVAGLLDELCATLSPRLVGRAPGLLAVDLPVPVDLELVHLVEHEGSLLLRWRLPRH